MLFDQEDKPKRDRSVNFLTGVESNTISTICRLVVGYEVRGVAIRVRCSPLLPRSLARDLLTLVNPGTLSLCRNASERSLFYFTQSNPPHFLPSPPKNPECPVVACVCVCAIMSARGRQINRLRNKLKSHKDVSFCCSLVFFVSFVAGSLAAVTGAGWLIKTECSVTGGRRQ